jgi:predicted ester cyclase
VSAIGSIVAGRRSRVSGDLKEIARRTWVEIFPACDVVGLEEVTDQNVVSHGARPNDPGGLAGVKKTMLWLARVFSDQRWEIRRLVEEGDTVVVHATHHGRHTGDLMGIPPTGREVAYDYVHILRYRDGKAVEHWSVRDSMALMQQLGAMPEQPAASPATR